MKLNVFDTDMLSLLQDGHPKVCERARAVPAEALSITMLAVASMEGQP